MIIRIADVIILNGNVIILLKDEDDAIFVSLKHLVYLLCSLCVLNVLIEVIMLCVPNLAHILGATQDCMCLCL